MNFTVIILGITVVILVYVLYLYMSPTYKMLSSGASLSVVNPPITSLVSPKNTSYAYGVWVYVNTWDSNIDKVIFSRAGNIALGLDATTPTLYVDVTLSDDTTTNPSIQQVTITDNFPIQKWVHVIISVDNKFLDCYLDGKLVISHKIGTAAQMPKNPPDKNIPIILGGNSMFNTLFDANVSKFMRWDSPVNPQLAWDTYMSGNGSSSSVSNFNANLSILKNNAAYSTFSLF